MGLTDKKLTDKKAAAMKAGEKEQKVAIGNSTYFIIPPKTSSASRWFRFDYRQRIGDDEKPKQKSLSLGSFPEVTIEGAIAEALRLRAILKTGGDPQGASGRSNAKVIKGIKNIAPTVGEGGTGRPFDVHLDKWLDGRNKDHEAAGTKKTRDSRCVYYLRPMGKLATDAGLAHRGRLKEILAAAPSSFRERIIWVANEAFELAIDAGEVEVNPIAGAKFKRLRQHKGKKRKAIVEKAPFGELLRKIAANDDEKERNATHLTIWTADRGGHVRKASWPEFDFDAGTWTLAFDGLKMAHLRDDGQDFIIPLPRQAIAMLRRIWEEQGRPTTGYVFPGAVADCVSEHFLRKALHKADHLDPHGFRASFLSIMRGEEDENGRPLFPESILDMCLDHKSDKVTAAYQRNPMVEARRKAMQHWADVCDRLRDNAPKKATPTLRVVA